MIATPKTRGIDKAAKSILAFIQTQANPISEAQIITMVRGRKQFKVIALRTLLAEDKIRRISGAGRRGDPFLYAATESQSKATGKAEETAEELLI